MNNKGFTLIEIVITISIFMIMVALAYPLMDMDLFYMEKMANEFVIDVRYIQKESMRNGSSAYIIGIDKKNRCYYITNNSIVEKTVVFKDRYLIDYSNTNMDSIGFTYEGYPLNAGTFKILDTKTNEVKEISIVPTTGRTVIKE